MSPLKGDLNDESCKTDRKGARIKVGWEGSLPPKSVESIFDHACRGSRLAPSLLPRCLLFSRSRSADPSARTSGGGDHRLCRRHRCGQDPRERALCLRCDERTAVACLDDPSIASLPSTCRRIFGLDLASAPRCRSAPFGCRRSRGNSKARASQKKTYKIREQ